MVSIINALIESIQPDGFFRRSFKRRCHMNTTVERQKMRPLLFSLESNSRVAREIVKDLHGYALEGDFTHVSSLIHLVGREIGPGPDVQHDPLRQLKLDAAIKLKVLDRCVSVLPVEILAFICRLHNGQALNIGLCLYPETVQQPSTGDFIKVYDPDCWAWQSSVMTLAPLTGLETCMLSHKSVIDLLHHADEIGVLQEITDPTDFFKTGWNEQLERVCRQQCSQCGAC